MKHQRLIERHLVAAWRDALRDARGTIERLAVDKAFSRLINEARHD